MNGAPALVPLPYSPDQVAARLGSDWQPTLRSAYRWMILARTLDARMQALQRQGRVGFYGAATGQEAVNVAAGLASRPEDWVYPGLREQLVALVRGHPLVTYAHHLFADNLDPGRGRNMPCHPTAQEVRYVSMSSVIGTQIDHAVGTAFALRHRHEPGAVLAFFGDGATSSNDFHAALNFGAVWGAPVVFCCTNNQWAISVPVTHQTAAPSLAAKSAEYGLPGRQVDGTDFVAVFAEVRTALEQARSGGGPTLLEFVLYRMTAHSSSDDPTRYQPKDWAARAVAHDPVARLEEWLGRNRLVDADQRAAVAAECESAVRDAVEAAEATIPPVPASLTEDVYASGSTGWTD